MHHEQAPGGIGAPDRGVEAGAASKAKIGSHISRHKDVLCDAIQRLRGGFWG